MTTRSPVMPLDFESRNQARDSQAISVVIAAYNAAATLGETLDSILQQSVPPGEIIVINDGSTDATLTVLERFGASVTVITQPNGGLARARNAGCMAAKGEFIAIIDADDLAHRDRLRVQLACLQSDPGIVLAYSDFSAFGEQERRDASHMRTYYSALRSPSNNQNQMLGARRLLIVPAQDGHDAVQVQIQVGNVYEHLAHGNFVHPPTMMFRRDLYAKAGPFDAQFSNGSDWDWIVRASRHGPFAFIDAPLLAYRLSPGQKSGQANRCPRYAGTVVITEHICANDPELFARDAARFKSELGVRYLDLADALADQGNLDALRKIAKAIKYDGIKTSMLRIAAKTVMPRSMLNSLRLRRGTKPAGRVDTFPK